MEGRGPTYHHAAFVRDHLEHIYHGNVAQALGDGQRSGSVLRERPGQGERSAPGRSTWSQTVGRVLRGSALGPEQEPMFTAPAEGNV